MNSFFNKLERRFGRYAIHNLPTIMIALYAAGYLLLLIMPDVLNICTLEPYYILRGQVWRIITWVLVPPSGFGIFTLIMLYFYFSIGRNLEMTWGAFRYNLYIFSGLIFTLAGAFLLYFLMGGNVIGLGYFFSTYYINMSIFLAFTLTYPEMQVLLYFFIPLKVKYLGYIYGAILIYDCIRGGWPTRVAIIASLMNFIIFMLSSGRLRRFSPKEIRRRTDFARKSRPVPPAGTKRPDSIHRCTVCGRTEKDHPGLEFRYCSKCSGYHEYCYDHLFTHEHIH